MQQAMIDRMRTFVSSVPITAEVVVGKSWAPSFIDLSFYLSSRSTVPPNRQLKTSK